MTVVSIATREILKGANFEKTHKAVLKAIPTSGFSKRCYYWYRLHLRTDKGLKVPPIKK